MSRRIFLVGGQKVLDDENSVYGVHKWLRARYGSADHCTVKGCSGLSETFEWCLKRGETYRRDRNAFFQGCRSCHMKYDRLPAANPEDCRYKYLLGWRRNHTKYNRNFMRIRRKQLRQQYIKGEIKYEDIPKSYQTFSRIKARSN